MLALRPRLLACLGVLLLSGPPTLAQEPEPAPLRLDALATGGVRTSVTESWGVFTITLRNPTDTDRPARVLVFYDGRPDVQYGRDVWVPARASLSTWMPVGPTPPGPAKYGRDLQVLLYDRSGGKDRLLLPPGEERRRFRGVYYQKRAPTTAIYLDELPPEQVVFGRLPQPESRQEEAVWFAHTFRAVLELPGGVQKLQVGPLPPTPEPFEGIDHLILASDRLAHDPAGLRALRHWLEQGGSVWVMLDQINPDTAAPLLGGALDFQVVDRVGLTRFRLERQPPAPRLPAQPVQEHDRPVDFVRVLLPTPEPVSYTIDGWPACFTRRVGRGTVLLTTLGARGWSRPRRRGDPNSADPAFPRLPVPGEPLLEVAAWLRPEGGDRFRVEAFGPLLTEQIGYAVVGRGVAALLFGAFLTAELALGIALRRSRRPELLGWLMPVAALAAVGAFVALGEASRRAAPTVALGQVVEAVPGTDEAAARGLLAVYQPDGGPTEAGAEQGGFFELDTAGLEGQARRRVQTDLDAWHWENLALPAGVRLGPFQFTARVAGPVTAVARLGLDGVEGQLTLGPFRDAADALLKGPGDRNLALRLRPDGAFHAGRDDLLPAGEFLAGAALSDRQQGRLELYRQFLKGAGSARRPEGNALLVWADAIEAPFTLAPGARRVGDALVVVPLRLEHPAAGARVTVPASLIACRRIVEGQPALLTRESNAAAVTHLRFQLPAEVLPFQVERARLAAKVNAPGRRVAVTAPADGGPVELYRADSPLDPLRIEITQERLLRLDRDGGLHLYLDLGEALEGSEGPSNSRQLGPNWTIDYLDLEVTGRTGGDKENHR
jgi:hypothetical protein